jgi:hypothetical protein
VVDIGVQVVNTDSIDTENLHESSITQALLLVTQRVLARLGVVSGTAPRLVGHSNDLEGIAVIIDKASSVNLERLDCRDSRGTERHECRLDLEEISCELGFVKSWWRYNNRWRHAGRGCGVDAVPLAPRVESRSQ